MMSLIQLKYVVEISKTKSITRAAENLYISQPNLSRSVRELEDYLGYRVFKRSPAGMIPTREGQELLLRAQNVLLQVAEMEGIGKAGGKTKQELRISAPRATYIAQAFAKLTSTLDLSQSFILDYRETNALKAVENIRNRHCNLAIVRYKKSHEASYQAFFRDRQLEFEKIASFHFRVLMSQKNPLAKRQVIGADELKPYAEIILGDSYIPSPGGPQPFSRRVSLPGNRQIFVYERGSLFDLLCAVPTTYAWGAPLPQELIDRYALAQCICEGEKERYQDVLLYAQGYQLTDLDKRFIQTLEQYKP